jgi:hypothetical protein
MEKPLKLREIVAVLAIGAVAAGCMPEAAVNAKLSLNQTPKPPGTEQKNCEPVLGEVLKPGKYRCWKLGATVTVIYCSEADHPFERISSVEDGMIMSNTVELKNHELCEDGKITKADPIK